MSQPMTENQFQLAYAELEAAFPLIYRPAAKKAAIARAVFVFEIAWFNKIVKQIINDPTRPIDIVKAAEAEYKARMRAKRTKDELANGEYSNKFLNDHKKEEALSEFGGARSGPEALNFLLKQKGLVKNG